jgi:hypothetical protein
MAKQSALLASYVAKGYRIVSETRNAYADQYTLVHD